MDLPVTLNLTGGLMCRPVVSKMYALMAKFFPPGSVHKASMSTVVRAECIRNSAASMSMAVMEYNFMGAPIRVDGTLPEDVIELRDNRDRIIGRITNIATCVGRNTPNDRHTQNASR